MYTSISTFDTPIQAQKSHEKLIAEKLKKGYVEVSASPESLETKVSNQGKSSSTTQATQSSSIESRLGLKSSDLWRALWRNPTPLKRPKVKPFDLAKAKEILSTKIFGRAKEISPPDMTTFYCWNWPQFSISLSREEAHFWFTIITQPIDLNLYTYRSNPQIPPQFEELYQRAYTGELTAPEMIMAIPLIQGRKSPIPPDLVVPIFNLVSLDSFIENWPTHDESTGWFIYGFLIYILPYLSEPELEALRKVVKAKLSESTEKFNHWLFMAAVLGMHDNLLPIIQSWPDRYLSANPSYDNLYFKLHSLLYGLADPDVFLEQLYRLDFVPLAGVSYYSIEDTRYILAHSGLAALDLVRDNILASQKYFYNKNAIEPRIKVICRIEAPEVAPYILELTSALDSTVLFWQWLNQHPEYSIPGLIPIAAGSTTKRPTVEPETLKSAAIDFLRSMKQKGYEASIQAALKQQPRDVVEMIQTSVIDYEDESALPSISQDLTPEDLQTQISELLTSTSKPLTWVTSTDLPQLAIRIAYAEGSSTLYRLTDDQISAVLIALKNSSFESIHPLVSLLKSYVDRTSLDEFIWVLFQRWIELGASSKEKWAMIALGLLGSDVTALQLTPLIRAWPGESQHARAVLGLNCLRAILTR